MKTFNAVVRTAVIGMLMGFAAAVVAQQPYPNKPIRFITPYAAGGSTEGIARIVAQKLTENWGQQVIVENRPGAGTMIGVDAVAKAPPDGYTILLGSGNITFVPLLLKAPYDPIKDLAPVATFARAEFVLVVNPSMPVNNLKEFIAYAKARPGELNYATPGAGGSQHLAHELLNQIAGIQTQHIPYKGATPALTDLLGGRVQVYFSSTLTAIPHIKSGRLKALAISGKARTSALPEVSTFSELGLKGLDEVGTWHGVMAPAGTPKEIIDKMSAEIAKYSAMADFRESLVKQGMNSFFSSPVQFAALLRSDLDKFSRIIKAANIKLEN